jgi:MoaF C-terminal domain/MoaF N-terminal domain
MTTELYEYVAPSDWKTLNVLEGFGRNLIPATAALASHRLDIEFTEQRWTVEFHDGERLTWAVDDGPPRDERYAAREVFEDLVLVDFHVTDRPEQAVVLLVDHGRSIVTAIVSTCTGETRHVREQVLHGWLPGGDRADRHGETAEMVGHRVQYVYGPSEVYEHIYLNSSTYSWHCVAGVERGQADTDFCRALKLRDGVYLFSWIERVVPCDGIAVIDWVNWRNNGRIFGWDTAEQEYNAIRMGARAVELNVTTYAPFT